MVIIVLMLLAFLAFVLAAAQAPIPRLNLVALGLALWVLTDLLQHVALHAP